MLRNIITSTMLAAVAIIAFDGAANARVSPYSVTCPIVVKVVHKHPTVVYTYRDCGAFVR
jgi:hypothetical protein